MISNSTDVERVHYQDLIALEPSTEEIDWAADWVRTQDVAPEFHAGLKQVADHVKLSLT